MTERDVAPLVDCPACGEPGRYWEDRIDVHDSIIGYEVRAAGILHDNGVLHDEW